MFIIYLAGNFLIIWVSRESDWSKLAKVYRKSTEFSEESDQVPGQVVLGSVQFGANTASVHKSGDFIVISCRKVPMFFGSMYMPDLHVPLARIRSESGGGGYLIDCQSYGDVHFKMVGGVESEIRGVCP
jgi:hypothetical protein